MNVTQDIIRLFGNAFQLRSSQEDLDVFEASYVSESITIPEEARLVECLDSITGADACSISINISNSDDILSYQKGSNYDNFKSSLEIKISGVEPEDSIEVRIVIEKKTIEGTLTIYSIANFEEYLREFSTSELLSFFSQKIKVNESLTFYSGDFSAVACSSSIRFINEKQLQCQAAFRITTERTKRLKDIRSGTHAVFLSDNDIIPDDFQFNDRLTTSLSSIFGRLNFASLIISIFDITDLSGDDLKFRLNGYKSIDGSANLLEIDFETHLDEYRKIYSWIYESGSLTDKLGLARNIISLHLNPENNLTFTGNIFNSIQSAYKVYEKQNIKQYIEIRNKMSDQLIDYNKRANTIVENFAGSFQKSALTVITLFSSFIALKVLGSSIMSDELIAYGTALSLIFIFISLIYMLITRSESIEQRIRYESSYSNFKERYTDLLNSEDIRKILNNDKEYLSDITFINKKIKNYTLLWVLVLSLIFIFITGIFINKKISDIASIRSSMIYLYSLVRIAFH